MRLILAALAALALAGPAVAATPEDIAAIATVQRFFDAMEAHDGAAVAAVTLPASVYTSIRPVPGGGTKINRILVEDFIKNLKPGLHEAMWSPKVVLRGTLMATVTAPYELKVDGKTVHCGIDVFDLAKVDGQWKIAGAIWTAEADACPELRVAR
ncbi:MAG: hypothetical protein KKB47_18520 [Alphaproteobacteria bacterium]|nr:hypothetical protein [Alphaproteobacteria bacterium]MBU1513017.1 hypothetical protein [Alphaproteobacteria bacterium]MBU2095125.1 hypothetical protein [Alphaproteobacteria bacterium]MBU2306376.1 hypothetical protein [Alphaproteobacteria bacterium]MBU2364857.1 hypothetical protein [Alphaproteobacteria bacterium]